MLQLRNLTMLGARRSTKTAVQNFTVVRVFPKDSSCYRVSGPQSCSPFFLVVGECPGILPRRRYGVAAP